jgi:putative membrane protein
MLFIIGLLLGGIAVIFAFQNIQPVMVAFLGWHFSGSLALLILISIVVGMIISWLLSLPEMLRLSDMRRHNRRLEKELEAHKQKLSETEGKLSQAEAPVVLQKTVLIGKEE